LYQTALESLMMLLAALVTAAMLLWRATMVDDVDERK
jgi:hypothetical protein